MAMASRPYFMGKAHKRKEQKRIKDDVLLTSCSVLRKLFMLLFMSRSESGGVFYNISTEHG